MTHHRHRSNEDREDPGALLAAVPHLIGYYPSESLIVLTFHNVHTRPELVAGILVDLPDPDGYDHTIAKLITPLLADPEISGVIAIITTPTRTDEDLPHRELVTRLAHECGEISVPVLQALWTPGFRTDAPWISYADPLSSGTIDDPTASPFALASMVAGETTYSSRDEVVNLLQSRCDEATAARWNAELDSLTEHSLNDTGSDRQDVERQLVLDTIVALHHGGEVTESVLIRVLHAIGDVEVRDAVLSTALGRYSRAAERLWITLIRSAPPCREVVEATVLLAFSAYTRGHGALAAIALERALDTDPDHTLTRLLTQATALGITPDDLAVIAYTTPPGPETGHTQS
ncbi:DUF4192 domain-containing protein [Saccharopolyspora sp. ID03-671]|uniref:DUF4192 domain-containing protein n=1 Tax=Saccharopolyspora sp. ID03-671 TaxID=3073066 RepID=UPI003254C659